jgi:hypothetical protein
MKHNNLNVNTTNMTSPVNIIYTLKQIYTFYINGFKKMKLGKKLWKIIFIKLFIMFAILKFFFFPNFLNTNFETSEEKSNFILEQITKSASFHAQEAPHE